jgi:hypothetical protein
MATSIDQCRAGFDALNTYFKALSKYYSDGVTLPDPNSLIAGFDFDELLTFVLDNANTAADFSVGAGVESLQHFVGVERELSMADVGKTSIYISAISEHRDEADFYDRNSAFFSGVMRGAPTSGSQC